MSDNNKDFGYYISTTILIIACIFLVYLVSTNYFNFPTRQEQNQQNSTGYTLYENPDMTSMVQKVAPTYKQCYDKGDGTTICCFPVENVTKTSQKAFICDHFNILKTENGMLIVRQTQ